MKGGDISNVSPPTIMFTLESVTTPKVETKKILGLIPVLEKSFEWDLQALNKVWLASNRYGVVTDLAVFDSDQKQVESYMEELDGMQVNPFNHATAYSDRESLVALMPYMFEVVGIVDTPDRVALYGSKGVELDRL